MSSEIKAIGAVQSQPIDTKAIASSAKNGPSFSDTLASQNLVNQAPTAAQASGNRLQNLFGNDLHRDIQKLGTDLVQGKEIPARELLVYQMKLGSFNQRVELVSKLAESAMATLRKFQQQQ